jgi:formylmethanofuran dehydrogenase subunit E
MFAHAGEKAQKSGEFHCAKCGEKVSVKEGHSAHERTVTQRTDAG